MIKFGETLIQSFVLAEDVRPESSGKFVIVGAFPSGLNIASFPARTPIAIYAELIPPRTGKHSIHFRLSGPGEGTGLVVAQIDVQIAGLGMSVFTPRFELLIENPGELVVSLSEDGSSWVEVTRRAFELGGAPTASDES